MQQEFICCACGCGAAFERFDKWHRERIYISGHNTRGKPAFHKPGPVAPRFWRKVAKADGCWEWIGYRRKPWGYGEMYLPGEGPTKAHRVSWMLHFGPIPDGLGVLHRCDNPPCVRPDHLFLGTPADNMGDMAQKGRHFSRHKPEAIARGERNGAMTHPESRPRGETHGMARTTSADVLEIRRLSKSGIATARLATQFSMTPDHVRRIVRRAIWKHLL